MVRARDREAPQRTKARGARPASATNASCPLMKLPEWVGALISTIIRFRRESIGPSTGSQCILPDTHSKTFISAEETVGPPHFLAAPVTRRGAPAVSETAV